MKFYILSLLLLFTSLCKAQSSASDIIFIPSDNSCVVTLTNKIVGIYVGGRVLTSQPNPYTYNTPYAQVTRLGADIKIFNDVSVLIGTRLPYGFYQLNLEPEGWVKLRLVNTIMQTRNNVDLTLMVGYSYRFSYGIGICLPVN